jgi:hypothetical protein
VEFGLAQGGGSSFRERALLDTLRRLMRRPEGWQALLFRPSLWEAARPEFRQVGHALLTEWASRLSGHVFILDDGDAFLFSREEGRENRLLLLRRTLEALFPAHVFSIWSLLEESAQLVAYLASRLTRAPASRSLLAPSSRTAQASRILPAGLGAILQDPVVRLSSNELELAFHLWRPAPGKEKRTESLPAGREGEHFLSLLADALTSRAENGEEPGAFAAAPVFLELAPEHVFTPAFSRLCELAGKQRLRVGALFTLPHLMRNPAMAEQAVEGVRARGLSCALGGVGFGHFADLHPPAFAPDWLLLEGGADLEACDGRELAALLRPLGTDAVVLTGVEDEATLRLGIERGLRLFTGTHAAALAAAARMLACPAASRCTLEACRDRASRLAPARRQGCSEPHRLDLAFTLTAPLP